MLGIVLTTSLDSHGADFLVGIGDIVLILQNSTRVPSSRKPALIGPSSETGILPWVITLIIKIVVVYSFLCLPQRQGQCPIHLFFCFPNTKQSSWPLEVPRKITKTRTNKARENKLWVWFRETGEISRASPAQRPPTLPPETHYFRLSIVHSQQCFRMQMALKVRCLHELSTKAPRSWLERTGLKWAARLPGKIQTEGKAGGFAPDSNLNPGNWLQILTNTLTKKPWES